MSLIGGRRYHCSKPWLLELNLSVSTVLCNAQIIIVEGIKVCEMASPSIGRTWQRGTSRNLETHHTEKFFDFCLCAMVGVLVALNYRAVSPHYCSAIRIDFPASWSSTAFLSRSVGLVLCSLGLVKLSSRFRYISSFFKSVFSLVSANTCANTCRSRVSNLCPSGCRSAASSLRALLDTGGLVQMIPALKVIVVNTRNLCDHELST